jgi:electron transfer flavoprotein beta subunit
MGIKKAKTKELKSVAATATTSAPSITLERVYLPERQKKTEMLTGSPAEIAAKIVEKLKFEVRVL